MPDEQIARGLVVLGDDFDHHRIRGTVTHAMNKGIDPTINIPLINHVEGNLWQGGCLGGVKLPDEFRKVFSLYPWEQYILGPDTERVEIKMYDSLDQACEQVDEIAKQVVEACSYGPTLVHCQAGLNRSGLVAGRALIYMGYEPQEAIALLRDNRSPLVLVNEAFEDYLLGCAA